MIEKHPHMLPSFVKKKKKKDSKHIDLKKKPVTCRETEKPPPSDMPYET
jgi:hypothetical protein